MQEDPRNISFSVLLRWAAWITFAAIARLSYRNSARSVLLATMPPTLAAARKTTCGDLSANQSNTAAWSHKSSSRRPAVSNSTFSLANRRTSALPTMPRWPATKTFLPFSSNGTLAIGRLALCLVEIGRDHLLHKLGKPCFGLPTKFLPRFAGVADQEVDLGRPEVCRIDPYHGLSGFCVDAALFNPLAAPPNRAADFAKGELHELADRARLAGGQHEIVGLVRLQDRVHALDIVAGMAPVALGFEIAEIDGVFQAELDAGDASGDLARDEGFATDRAFMVEQDAIGGEHSVRLAVIHGDPVTV